MLEFTQRLTSKISSLPKTPGVYIYKDKNGKVIYIGKAKNLRARVRQYFAGHDERPQIPYLMKEVVDLEYTMVRTELESLYLERTLIQKHRPKYNIDLRDDKNYAFITIDYTCEIPQVTYLRKFDPANKHVTYFGPYTSAKKINSLIFTVRRVFGLCAAQKIGKPCFYYHLHRCPGVCAGVISVDEYKQHLEKIKLFLKGRTEGLIKSVTTEMAEAAKKKRFEKAARLRDELKNLENSYNRQNVIFAKPVDWDIIALANDGGIACVNLFKVRGGRLIDRENFIYKLPAVINAGRNLLLPTVQTFLETYYLESADAPKEIYVQYEVTNAELVKKLIKNRFNKIVKISVPQKGKAKELINLSELNAREYLKNHLAADAGNLDKINQALAKLKEVLNLPAIPKRIECYDISNTQGTNAVGSMVVFLDGMPAKSQYRKFKIRTKDTPDDFTMMKEMLTRRLARGSEKGLEIRDKNRWPLPDLIVIDGGKGQLSAALSVLSTSPFALSPTTIGLAKRIEEIFLPNKPDPIILPHSDPALQMLQRLRDEAHRFGITFHRQLRSKQAVKSTLDEIPGIGPKTKKLLKQKFGTVANIKKASFDEIKSVVGEKLAGKIMRST